jgi:hypothetical protein
MLPDRSGFYKCREALSDTLEALIGELFRNGRLQWPRVGRLKWPRPASVD